MRIKQKMIKINSFNRLHFIRKLKEKVRLADECIEKNKECINIYLSINDEKEKAEFKHVFDKSNEDIERCLKMKERWNVAIDLLEKKLVKEIEWVK